MSDIRLPEESYEYKGKTYKLRCNFNVLADIEDECGSIPDITKNKLKNFTIILSAMMNDYAEEQGWSERVTPRELGRSFATPDPDLVRDVMNLFVKAVYRPVKKGEAEEPKKN